MNSLSIDNHEMQPQPEHCEINLEIVMEDSCTISVKCTEESFTKVIGQL